VQIARFARWKPWESATVRRSLVGLVPAPAGGSPMTDLWILLLTLASFVALVGFARLCDAI
jgi:hypothetical protein